MNPTLLIVLVVMVVGWGAFFVWRSRVQKSGGFAALARAHLNQRFGLSGDEQVSAAWNATTVPKLSTGEKVARAVGAAASVVGLGFEYVGRPLGVACTTKNRVLILDREDGVIRAYGPEQRPRFAATGKKGTQRASQTQVGFDAGAIMMLELPGIDALEIDLPEQAVSVLVGWSKGAEVAGLAGPYPAKGAI